MLIFKRILDSEELMEENISTSKRIFQKIQDLEKTKIKMYYFFLKKRI